MSCRLKYHGFGRWGRVSKVYCSKMGPKSLALVMFIVIKKELLYMWNKLRLIILEFYYLVYDVCIMDVLEASSNALFYLQMRFFFFFFLMKNWTSNH
jgi:hypothetical protein